MSSSYQVIKQLAAALDLPADTTRAVLVLEAGKPVKVRITRFVGYVEMRHITERFELIPARPKA